jgi:hypothetical protein
VTPYEILQVSPSVSLEELKIAYRTLAKRYHPDTNKSPNAVTLFQLVNTAYEQVRKNHRPAPKRVPRTPIGNGLKLYRFVSAGTTKIDIQCGQSFIPPNSCVFLMQGSQEYRVHIQERQDLPLTLKVDRPNVILTISE